MSLLAAPFAIARTLVATSMTSAELVGSAVTAVAAGLAADTLAATQSAAAVLGEAAGVGPARRFTSTEITRWIEVRGLGTDGVAEAVGAALRATPGVTAVHLNGPTARVVVTVTGTGPTAQQLARVIAAAEESCGVTGSSSPSSLPGDDALVATRMVATTVSAVGLGAAALGSLLPIRGIPRLVAAPVAMADHHPKVRRIVERRLGVEGADLAFACVGAVTGALGAAPASLLSGTLTRAMQTMEAVNGRRAWERMEPCLTELATKSGDIAVARRGGWHPKTGARYAEGSIGAGIVGAMLLGVFTDPDIAGAAAAVATPKPIRSVRESFCCAVSRGLQNNHGALVLQPQALRWLADLDTVVIDPRILYTDSYTVSRVRGLPDTSLRAQAWAAANDALEAGELSPGWNALSNIPGAGEVGEALVSAIRDPLAAALVTEARTAGTRVITVADDGLRSLKQGFDELVPCGASLDDTLAEVVAALQADGAKVTLLSASGDRAALDADLSVGVMRDGGTPPWGADILVPDLAAAWRVLRTLPAARVAADKGVSMSAGSSVLGTLMLIPSVPGSGPASVDMTATLGLWSGFGLGRKVFGEPLPNPESGHDWYALPVEEIARLLPRPTDPTRTESTASSPGPVVGIWRSARDYVATMRADLSDPMTPVLATGAVASALLGSPLDALMVGAVLLGNAAISAQQTVHAEHLLDRLLAVQEPPARLLACEGGFRELPSAALHPGDLVEVRSGEVVPADLRLLEADGVEVDESALTGESLPVAKDTEPTPGAPLAERSGMLHAGTTMVAGRAVGIVVGVGPSSQIRRALAMSPVRIGEVGLAAQLGVITKKALPWSLAGGGLVGLLSLLRRTPIRDTASGTVSIAVAAVPEGLPLVVTLAQSASARQLTGSSVLIRNPRAIEAFARLDAVCFDKTGTLSENRLRVTAVRPLDGFVEHDVLAAAAATMVIGDGVRLEHATDQAVHDAADERGIPIDGFDVLLPFQSDRPFAAALVGTRIVLKGAPDVLVRAFAVPDSSMETALDAMAADGLRVLAVAYRDVTATQAREAAADPAAFEALCRTQLCPLGLLGLADTPRQGARELLEELQSRGIGVKLITGDHPLTAAVIAGQLGLPVTTDEVLTSAEWDAMTVPERSRAAQHYRVFARMSPEHKVEVVQALESVGVVTAMVGDGANDAAAIRAASVGVGVVSAGSDPARMAADVMLLDGQIGALVSALDEGEQLWRRVQSAVSMLLGHNVGEVTFGVITSLLTGRPALSARQMLLVNMLTDALPAAAVAVSTQVPRDGVAHHDEASIWRAVAVRGVFTTLGATLAWAMALPTGSRQRAATVALIGLVLSQMMQTLSDSHGPLVIATNVGTVTVMAGIISTPGLSQLFGCTPVGPIGWGQAVVSALLAGGVATLLPGVIDRVAERLSVIDGEDADAHQEGVDMLDGGGQEADTGIQQGVGAELSHDVVHTSEPNPVSRDKEGLPN
ncbi:cation-translocating P-type ATPase [Mycobacterium sp. 155]|uniref:cation-translocating P-type ATPase n=1 Tax=Mycobacterium sp. 155 TaxID=1157943 RepID=UPI00035FC060|nr:cation-translocating P-type ATPase [Mycobacterium sp. 155]